MFGFGWFAVVDSGVVRVVSCILVVRFMLIGVECGFSVVIAYGASLLCIMVFWVVMFVGCWCWFVIEVLLRWLWLDCLCCGLCVLVQWIAARVLISAVDFRGVWIDAFLGCNFVWLCLWC